MRDFRDFEVERKLLVEKIRLEAYTRISWMSQGLAVNARSYVDLATNDLVIQLEALLSSCRLHCEEHAVMVPASWWQMFKESYFPLWAKRRWPVINRPITNLVVTQYLLLPNVPINMDREQWEVRVAQSWSEDMARWSKKNR